MSWPSLKYRAAKIEARRDLSPNERLIEGQKDVRFWTNFGLSVAVFIGVVVVLGHGGVRSSGIAAFGAALGTGGVLGFLFGVPSASKAPVNINNAGTVAVATGNDSKTTGGNVTAKAPDVPPPTNPDAAAAPEPNQPLANNAPTDPGDSGNTTTPTPPPTSQSSISYTPTISNLEQVADWVTKLLLGGGLTQMQHIPPKVWQWAHIVALGIIGDRQISEQMLIAEQAFAAGVLVYGFILGFFSGFLITKLQLGKAISD